MSRSRLGLLAIGLVAVLGLSACGSSSKDSEAAMQQQIDGLHARVTSLESRMTWVEVVGRKAIAANPAVYVDQLTADVAALEADFAAAQASAAAASDQVATEKAAAEKAVADAKTAVAAAVAAAGAARTDAIEAAEARVAEAKAALEALKQKIQDALGSAAPSSTASSTATPSST